LIKITNNEVRFMSVPNAPRRFLQLAELSMEGTSAEGLIIKSRSFVCFVDKVEGQFYVEETTNGKLEQVKDDGVWEELNRFAQSNLLTLGPSSDVKDPRIQALLSPLDPKDHQLD